MEITFRGANAVSLSSKLANILVDPVVPGLDVETKKADVILLSANQTVAVSDEQLLINTPGEYEARGVSVKGIAARAHMDEEGKHSATMYRIDAGGFRVAVIGHIYPELNDEQLEALGTIDILIVPVGGYGYTLDASGAAGVVRAIEPSIVIPTHYADTAIKYEVPQAELKVFTDELGAPVIEEDSYKVKEGGLPEQLTVVALSRSS